MTTEKARAAEALAPMLSAFHAIADQRLQRVWQFHTEGSLDKLALDFGALSLIVIANEDDDSINIALSQKADQRDTGGVDATHTMPWSSFIGKHFGWGWVTVNQQGYCDGLLLSFGGIIPSVVLNVIASSIKVSAIPGNA